LINTNIPYLLQTAQS